MKTGRVALGGAAALVLWIGFYLLGLGIAGLLALLPWAQSTYEGGVQWSGALAGVLALVMLWAIFPRFTREEPKGPSIGIEEHPRLRALVAEVATRVGMPAPDELHVIAQANAFASSRSVGVGLPLLVLLDREELASVVAHELGHHHAGHLRFGPWVYRMRRAIAGALGRLEGSSFWLHLPFVAYARLFLRVTRSTSRLQELHADEVAASACGAEATRAALERIHEEGLLWQAYFGSEVLPLLRRGFCPPLVEGFRRFRQAPGVADKAAEVIAKIRQEEEKPDILDTHPTLAARVAALGGNAVVRRQRGEAALDLLDDVGRAERAVLDALIIDGARLEDIHWDDAPEKVWIPYWERIIEPHASVFARRSPLDIPDLLADRERLTSMTRQGVALLSPAAERRRFTELCGAWLTLELARRGFTIESDPGEPVRARRGDQMVETFASVSKLDSGELSAEAWRDAIADI